MSNIKKRLQQIIPKIESDDFIQNKGLGNEIGYYVFDYDPQDELIVRDFVRHIKKEFNHIASNRRIIQYDLYEILIDICRDYNILAPIAQMEEKRGRDKLLDAIVKVANTEAYIKKMSHDQKPGDVIFITGVGKVYPFMRSHNILNNLQHIIDKVPVVMFFPGTYDGQSLRLFNRMNDDNYYRAFQLVK